MTHVFVVDDDLTVRNVVRRYLERGGHQVSLADNGEEALRRLRQRSSIPVVMLTALGEEENSIAGQQLGADDYVTKPFSPREFDLSRFLMSHPGEVFSREQLLGRVWAWDFGDQSTVTVHVRRLREKIEDVPAKPSRIVTVWGVGYRYDRT